MTGNLSERHPSVWLVGAQAVAEMLDVSARTVYRLAYRGEIPHLKVGGQYRFDEQRVREVLDSQATNR